MDWILVIIEFCLLVAVIVYTVGTFRMLNTAKGQINRLDQQIELLNRDIKLSKVPRLSLGLTEKSEYYEFYENQEDFSEKQIESYKSAAEDVKEFYYFRNVSDNTAFQIRLILFKPNEIIFGVSKYTHNYILPHSKSMDFLTAPISEEAVRVELEKVYGRDITKELSENGILNGFEGSLCYILIYTDFANNLYILRRSADYIEDEGFRVYYPKYYDLGTPE
jgi:hypothetical protein